MAKENVVKAIAKVMIAAAWVDVLSLEEIAIEIQQSVDFLATEMRDLPRRQWSMTVEYDRCPAPLHPR